VDAQQLKCVAHAILFFILSFVGFLNHCAHCARMSTTVVGMTGIHLDARQESGGSVDLC
jgi:hypothetical protein